MNGKGANKHTATNYNTQRFARSRMRVSVSEVKGANQFRFNY